MGGIKFYRHVVNQEMPEAIETDRLLLQRVTPDDAAFIIQAETHPEIRPYLSYPYWVQTPDDIVGYILDQWDHGYGPYVITKKETGEKIGLATLIATTSKPYPDDLGWRILPEHRGHGYATEAAKTLRAKAFEILNINRVVHNIIPGNAASIRVAEKLGGTRPPETTDMNGKPILSFETPRPNDIPYPQPKSDASVDGLHM
jgi:RimJ/RimL family protein N-acetyltransferase